ncbi:MAG TPA: ABC transporter ATP-binding protein [Nitrososphaerales archaeon]|nr:ABC transporter ATP-binding protein [Nitrososphaerales archaeon]
MNQNLLSVESLRVVFPTTRGNILAVDNIDLAIGKAETVGLVGESGSGKTITGRAVMNLVPRPGKIAKGKIVFKGKNLLSYTPDQMRSIRGKEISAIQQDPLSSLNPAFKVQTQMTDILTLHKSINKSEAISQSVEILKQLGITNPAQVMQRYPHQLSGGMAQRIMIGIAFSCGPSLVIADEPTTALDVITQAAVIELMKKFQKKSDTSVLFITHNLGLAAKVCDKIAVMYAGKIVEFADVREIFRHPSHPYTKSLLTSVPKISDTAKKIPSIIGGMPNLINPPKGCRFYPRCSMRIPACKESEIKFVELGPQIGSHRSLCLRAQEISEIPA